VASTGATTTDFQVERIAQADERMEKSDAAHRRASGPAAKRSTVWIAIKVNKRLTAP